MQKNKRLSKQEMLSKIVKKKHVVIHKNDNHVKEQPFRALLNLHAGTGDFHDWKAITFRLYAGIEMTSHMEPNAKMDYKLEIESCIVEMDEILQWYRISNKWEPTPKQMKYISDMLIITDAMHELLSPCEVLTTIYRKVENMINKARK